MCNALLSETEGYIVESVTDLFEAACRPYLAQLREFRLASSVHCASGDPDLSPTFCQAIAALQAEFDGMGSALPQACLRRVWPQIGAAVDEILYTQLVRQATFSPSGARQLLRDVGALERRFLAFTSKPQAALRRLHESCGLLALPDATRAELVAAILTDTPPHAQQREHEASLRRRLEEHGVFRLSVGEAREILDSVHSD